MYIDVIVKHYTLSHVQRIHDANLHARTRGARGVQEHFGAPMGGARTGATIHQTHGPEYHFFSVL